MDKFSTIELEAVSKQLEFIAGVVQKLQAQAAEQEKLAEPIVKSKEQLAYEAYWKVLAPQADYEYHWKQESSESLIAAWGAVVKAVQPVVNTDTVVKALKQYNSIWDDDDSSQLQAMEAALKAALNQ